MTEKELQSRLKAMSAATKEACKSEEAARAFLQKVGIITKSGKLASPYS